MSSKLMGILALIAVVGVLGVYAWQSEFGNSTSPGQIRNDPISLEMGVTGELSVDGLWHVSVDSAGRAKLISHEKFPQTTSRKFRITPQQFGELRKTLLRERFFDLSDEYGENVPDGSTDTLNVSMGEQKKTVKLHYLGNWVNNDKKRLCEPARALRVWILIQAWFNHPSVIESRRYKQMLIDAAEEA